MRFVTSTAHNFRNLRPGLKIDWDSGINLILGQNGAGKTNLLETLSILTGWGHFLGKTRNLITWGSEIPRAIISAEISGEHRFTLSASISSRISLKQDGKTTTFTDLRLSLPSILFTAGSVNLIDGSPSSRRLFIDRLCALFSPPYARRLAEFRYVMRTRSALLRQGKSPNFTTIPYCKLGGWLMDTRREIVRQLSGMISPDNFTLSMLPVLSSSGAEYLHEELLRNYAREIRTQRPQAGPNYDELMITCANGRYASESLSRGQKRRLIFHLIITAGKLISLRLKRKPVLLFDDLTAELDTSGREWIYTELKKTGWQVFITAPEDPFFGDKPFLGGTKIRVSR